MSDWTTPEPRDAETERQVPQEAAPADDLHAAAPPASPPSTVPLRYHDADGEPVASEPAEPPVESEVTEAPTPEPTSWLHPDPVEPVGLGEPEAVQESDEPPSFAANADYVPPTGLPNDVPSVYVPPKPFEDIVFDVADLTVDERRAFSQRLTEAHIVHRIESGDQLTIQSEAAGTVETWLEDWRLRRFEEVDVPESDDVEEVISDADDEEDEIVFDLASLSTEERRHLSMRLTGAGIAHIWEVASDLVVSVADAPAIERYVEEVRNPDGFGDEEIASFEEDADVDDEEVYAAMSNLYVAADKLMQRPADEATAGEFYAAVDDVDGLPAPFGFDPRVWSQVQDLANKIADTLDAEGDPNDVGADAKTLRQILANYV